MFWRYVPSPAFWGVLEVGICMRSSWHGGNKVRDIFKVWEF